MPASADGVSRPGSERVFAPVHAASEHTVHAELPAGGRFSARSCNIPDVHRADAWPRTHTEHGRQGERAWKSLPAQRALPLLRQVMETAREHVGPLHRTGASLYLLCANVGLQTPLPL